MRIHMLLQECKLLGRVHHSMKLESCMKLSRRSFVAAAAPVVLASQSCQSLMISSRTTSQPKPRAIEPGAVIGLVCPGSPIPQENVDGAKAYLERRGFGVKLGEHLTEEYLCELSGTDEQRLADLNGMINDPKVDAIFTLRGGYGSNRLLDRIDYAGLARHQKWFTGFSDITAIHVGLYNATSAISMHGPAFGYSFNRENKAEPFVERSFWRMVKGHSAPGPMDFMTDDSWTAIDKLKTWVPGKAVGRIVGGNLSRMASMAGTPWAVPENEDIILFIEDIYEAAYRVDRYLVQLRDSGAFSRVKGLVIGQHYPREEDKVEETPLLANVLKAQALALGKPALAGVPIGHHEFNMAVAHGALVEFDADAQTIHYLEAVTS